MKDSITTKTYFIGNLGIRFMWSLDGCWTITQHDLSQKYTTFLYLGPVSTTDNPSIRSMMLVFWKLRIMCGYSTEASA